MATKSVLFKFPGESQHIIVRWVENTAPTTEIGRQKFDYPSYVSQVWCVAQSLNPVVHTFEFWRSADGVSLDILLDSIFVDASISSSVIVERFEYIVDRGYNNLAPVNTGTQVWSDPVSGTDTLNDQRLNGATQDELSIAFRGLGELTEAEYQLVAGGGLQILNSTFQAGDTIIVHWFQQVQFQTTTTVSSGAFSDIKIVTDNETFGADYYNKNCLANFPGIIGATDFPALALIPNKTKVRFSTYFGSQRYWKLQFNAGDTIHFAGKDRNLIYLGNDEEIELFFDAGVAYIIKYKGDYATVGEYFLGNKGLVNTELCNGVEYNIADYPRLIEELTPEQRVSYADYDVAVNRTIGNITRTYYPNRGKVAIATGAGKFKVPDLRGFSPRALLTGPDAERLSQGAGGLQAMDNAEHEHGINTTGNQGGVDPGRGIQRSSANGDGFSKGGGTRHYVEAVGGTETRVDNYGQYILIRY